MGTVKFITTNSVALENEKLKLILDVFDIQDYMI